MAMFAKQGYGQVEPNRLGGQKGGLLPSQLPYGSKSDSTITYGSTLENGHFCKYDEANGLAVDANSNGDIADAIMLVFCEEKRYDERDTGRKNFRLEADKSIDGKIYPRLVPMQIGDAYTTNYLDIDSFSGTSLVGQVLEVVNGIPKYAVTRTAGRFTLQAVKETTLPDGQKAYKLMRVQ